MEIRNPRRIMCLGAPNSGVLTLLKDLTGSAPTPLTLPSAEAHTAAAAAVRTTTAGLGHELRIRTRYYDADVPMWLDEVASPGAWKADFLGDEACEVVRALGAWMVVFRREGASEEDDDYVGGVLAAVRQVVERAHGGDGGLWDGVCLAVGMPRSTVGAKAGRGGLRERTPEEWEDLCGEYGFEYVAGDDVAVGRSAEGDLSGVARLREALEANDWSGGGDEDELEDEFLFDGDGEGDGEDPGFGLERRELEEEFAGLRTGGGVEEDDVDEPMQVEELEAMMLKVQATRDLSAHLPIQERRKVAAKMVKDLLKNG